MYQSKVLTTDLTVSLSWIVFGWFGVLCANDRYIMLYVLFFVDSLINQLFADTDYLLSLVIGYLATGGPFLDQHLRELR